VVYLVRNDGGRGEDEGGPGPCPHHRPPHQWQGQEGVRQEFQALHPGIEPYNRGLADTIFTHAFDWQEGQESVSGPTSW
jgi:hypothetical protein